jgi:hypothetical protein
VRNLEVRYDLKVLLPHGIFLILHCGGSGDVTLTQRGECDVGCLLDGTVGLTANDGLRPWILLVEGYRHVGLAYVQAIGHRQAIAVDRDFPVIAEIEECIVKHSLEPQAMLARGTKSPILDEEEVGVVIQVHLKA